MENSLELHSTEVKRSGGIDAFWLKIIAIIGMTMDHTGIILGEYMPFWLNCILFAFGGLTFPIMAYLLCEGYRHTRSVTKYCMRLLVFAVITQLPYSWALMSQLNVLFTILLGLLAIHLTQKVNNVVLSILIVVGFTAVSAFCDWGLMGVPMIICYYYLKNRWAKVVVPILFPVGMMGLMYIEPLLRGYWEVLPNMLFVFVGCVLTIPLLANYNGQRGRSMRYFFYAYYPAHIAVLGLLRGLIFGYWGSLF